VSQRHPLLEGTTTSSDRPIVIRGAHSSPYSLKMRAVLRYRHIPFRWVLKDSALDTFPAGSVPVIPVLIFPGDDGAYSETLVDSSPQITRLEADHSQRSLVPTDPALAFIDFLLEDFADEWVTKAMYHYRWTYDADIEKAGLLLPLDRNLQAPDDQLAKAHDFIIERQVGRRALVGSTDQNQPILEGSFERLLDILQEHLANQMFLFGKRPARSDVAMYGQLKPMLWWDPTSTALASARAPRVVNWIERVDDLSSWPVADEQGGWDATDALAPTVRRLLEEAGRTYAPFMIGNAEALQSGADEMSCSIDGATYSQGPFGYQGKCLMWLREQYAALADDERADVDGLLAGTGCEILFT
jgi:glutathione S-transferase